MPADHNNQKPDPENGMTLGEALALTTAADLVHAFLTDTGQTQEAETLGSAKRKFKRAIKNALPTPEEPPAPELLAFIHALTTDQTGDSDARFN